VDVPWNRRFDGRDSGDSELGEIMTSVQLRKMVNAQPFRPLDIHLADGRKLHVKHPEFIAASPNGRTAIIFDEDDTFEAIDVLHITSIEVRNGRRKRSTKK